MGYLASSSRDANTWKGIDDMNIHSVKGKVLAFVLPVVILGLAALSGIAYKYMDSAIENLLVTSATTNTEHVSKLVESWLDARMLETQETASSVTMKGIKENPEAAKRNNEYRLKLMNQRYPDVYDSVSWGYFDGSGTLYGQAKDGAKEMHNADKAWYKDTMTGAKESFMAPPVVSQASGRTIVNSIALIKDDAGQNIGMVLAAVNTDSVAEIVSSFKMGQKGYSLLVSQDGTYIVSPDAESVMKKKITDKSNAGMKLLGTKMTSGETGNMKITLDDGRDVVAFYHPIENTGWSMATVADKDELFAPANSALKALLIVSIILIIVISAIIIFVLNKVLAPLKVMMEEMKVIAGGDFRDTVSHIDSDDEIGMLAAEMHQMRGNVREMIHSVNDSTETLASSTEEVNATTEQSAQASHQIAESITEVAEGATKQLDAAENAEEVVSDLANHMRETNTRATAAAKRGEEAAAVAQEGGRKLEGFIQQMKDIAARTKESSDLMVALGERSKEIGQINDTIASIAEQTNLLALNAAIEAARAGENGRGFSVVAEEVRKLAESSQEAAQQISSLIGQIQQDTEGAVKSMEAGAKQVTDSSKDVVDTSESFRHIVDIVNEVSGDLQVISHEMETMNNNGAVITDHVRTIGGLSKTAAEESETVSAASEEQAASVHEIATASGELAKLAEQLQGNIAKFKF